MKSPTILAVSGPDNVGKSTQLRILARRLHPTAESAGALHHHDSRWKDTIATGMATWWFASSTPSQLADVLASSYLARHAALPASRLRLVDRGIPMLEATLAATLSVRLNLSDDDAYDEALELLRPYRADLQACEDRETGIVLLHSADADDSAARSLARENDASETYQRYQLHLARQILRLVDNGRFTHTILVEQRSIMSVQDELRDALARLGFTMVPAHLSRARIVALGGMSESGKSSAADWLRRRHSFTRLKIGYLLDQAAARHHINDLYALDETTQAELLIDSLDRFLAAQYFSDRVTIESLHRYEATTALQALLGPALSTVYLDTAERLRRERGAAGPADITERDRVKRSRGADQIIDIADVVIHNNGSVLHLYHELDRVAWSMLPATTPRLTTASALDMPPSIAHCVDQLIADLATAAGVDLIAVTGSGGRGKYQHGWSDLDVLIVAEPGALAIIRKAAQRLRDGIDRVKLGLTVITRQECQAGVLTPRLIHVVRQIATREIGVQWCTPGLSLPCPSADDDALASLSDGALAAVELRRQLLRPSCDTRSVFKLAALLAKVMLRVVHQDPPDDEAALRTLIEKVGLSLDPRLISSARTNPAHARTIAEAMITSWLEALPPARDIG